MPPAGSAQTTARRSRMWDRGSARPREPEKGAGSLLIDVTSPVTGRVHDWKTAVKERRKSCKIRAALANPQSAAKRNGTTRSNAKYPASCRGSALQCGHTPMMAHPGKRSRREQSAKRSLALYSQSLKSSRTGPLFSAFPYPTKILPETIALFIGAHTKPGDTVFDGFAGSGTTGIAALLCAAPTTAMRDEAKRLGLQIEWGPRRAVLREIGVLGSFVAHTLCDPPDPNELKLEAERVLRDAERELGWMYGARDPKGQPGKIRYVIWSEVLACPSCGMEFTYWEGCVRRKPARINSGAACPHCSRKTPAGEARRRTKATWDALLSERITGRVRRSVWIYGATGARTWSRPVEPTDRSLLARISKTPLPDAVPRAKVPWGDLHRSGYHQGITHLHHFYTRRNLIAFASLWQRANSSPLRDALRFWLLSYNASHGTLMTRVVAKKGQADFVVTSSQPGVLYISGLPVEKNLFDGLRRKLNTICDAFKITRRAEPLVDVTQGSCLLTDLPDRSIDYVFTDPPFGGNIPYAEVNFINEAWLGKYTAAREEITISRVQEKDVSDYETLMAQAFAEIRRILKDDAKASVVFHSSSARVWNALQRAYTIAGLNVEVASILDKTQGSFKQVTTAGAVKGDPVLLLRKPAGRRRHVSRTALPVMEELLKLARASGDASERTPQRLYSRFVAHFLTREQSVPLDAEEFYQLVAAKSLQDDASSSAE